MAYDSRSDKPRTTHHHMYCRSDATAPPEPLTREQAIAEGLAELEGGTVSINQRTVDAHDNGDCDPHTCPCCAIEDDLASGEDPTRDDYGRHGGPLEEE